MFKECITPQEIEKLEYASFPGKIYVIDSVGAEFNRAIAYLRSQKIIGFDTETRPTFTPSQPRYGVALLQLSGPDKAFLFRVNKIGMHRRLCNLLSSSKILKVGAAIHDDIRGLQRLRDFQPDGLRIFRRSSVNGESETRASRRWLPSSSESGYPRPSSFQTGRLRNSVIRSACMRQQMHGSAGRCTSS